MAQGGRPELERLAATESLLRIGHFADEDREILLQLLRVEGHPYILKNLLLMLPLAGVSHWKEIAEEAVRRCPEQIMVDCLAWMGTHPDGQLLSLPDLEPPFTRRTRYPDFESYSSYIDTSG
jgi:hypothetical protein